MCKYVESPWLKLRHKYLTILWKLPCLLKVKLPFSPLVINNDWVAFCFHRLAELHKTPFFRSDVFILFFFFYENLPECMSEDDTRFLFALQTLRSYTVGAEPGFSGKGVSGPESLKSLSRSQIIWAIHFILISDFF